MFEQSGAEERALVVSECVDKTSDLSASGWGTTEWEIGIKNLESSLDPQLFDAYIKPIRFDGFDSDRKNCNISVPSALIKIQLERNYKDTLESNLRKALGNPEISLNISVEKIASAAGGTQIKYAFPVSVKVKKPVETIASESSRLQASNINPKYTFDSFVVGSSNQFCHAAAERVAEEPGLSYNPLFIYGGVGLGKTHLLHAIGNAALKKNPRLKVLYLSSEGFTNDLIQALRNGTMEQFKQKLRTIDILLIDDIQFISGKERTQEEFFHTFNTLYDNKKQIVITSDRVPNDVKGLEERLKTRFSWGLAADLQAPDFETRVAILKHKAQIDRLDLDEEVAKLVAEQISSNVRELEGALTRLGAIASLKGSEITRELAETALAPLLTYRPIKLTVDDIKKAVALHFSIKVSDLSSKSRTRSISFPRHIAMYLCRKHTTASYPEIGTAFGGRDHSSVIHASNVVTQKVEVDGSLKETISKIEKDLMS